jgi:hypothetical protein
VTGDCHAGICGSRGVQFPPATRPPLPRLRALQPDPGPRGGTNKAAARKASKQSSHQARPRPAGHRASPSHSLDRRFPHGRIICARRGANPSALRAANIRQGGCG